jgi:hypothetical protein
MPKLSSIYMYVSLIIDTFPDTRGVSRPMNARFEAAKPPWIARAQVGGPGPILPRRRCTMRSRCGALSADDPYSVAACREDCLALTDEPPWRLR